MPGSTRLLVLGFFLVALGGRFSLDRLVGSGEGNNLLLAPRYWATAALVIACIAVASGSRLRARMPGKVWSYLLAVTVLHGFLALGAGWTQERTAMTEAVLDSLLLPVLVIGMVWSSGRHARRCVDVVFVAFFISSLAYAAAGFSGFGQLEEGRLSAFTGGANVFVRVMASGVLASVYLYLTRRRSVFLLAIPALLIGAMLSGSRGGVIALVVALIPTAYAYLRRTAAAGVVLQVGLVAIAGIVTVLLIGEDVVGYVSERYIQLTLGERYTSDRGDIFRAAIDVFRDHPGWGAGLRGFYAEIGRVRDWEYPHNLPLTIAAEGGLIGLALLGWALKSPLALTLQKRRGVEVRFALLLGWYYFTASLFSGSTYDARFMWVMFGLALLTARETSTSDVVAVRHGELPGPSRRVGGRPEPLVNDDRHIGAVDETAASKRF